jgi:glycosyltransferase involved in cell wall biosynthesis
MRLSAIVLTKNEEANIRECLAALSFADEVLVIDSGSTDRTITLAESLGARAIIHPMTDFASQRNFAMAQAKGDWVLFIDADERVTPELAGEIKAITQANPPNNLRGVTLGLRNFTSEVKAAYAIPRQTYFFGRRLRFGDARTDAPVRFFPRDGVLWEQPVHEMIVTDLPIRILKNPMPHYTTRDLAQYRKKMNEYVSHELKVLRAKGVRPGILKVVLMTLARFLQLYFFRLGILDGVAGFQYAILSAYYTFEKYWRYWKGR